MPQSAAQPILDLRDQLAGFAGKVKSWPKPESKVDTRWHDEMVRKANESFRKAPEKKYVTKPAEKAAIRKKPTAGKARPKKKVAGRQ
jgi:hypothetical protein